MLAIKNSFHQLPLITETVVKEVKSLLNSEQQVTSQFFFFFRLKSAWEVLFFGQAQNTHDIFLTSVN